ncbi:unnamed protein product [Ectocarpus sp. 12 AP-2014]
MVKDEASSFGGHSLPDLSVSPTFGRQTSAREAESSNCILGAVESGDHAKLREGLSGSVKPPSNAVLAPSMSFEHRMRTPLMAAAATGSLALFTTVLHAVNRAIGEQRMETNRISLRKKQLEYADESGMTLLMLAASSGNVGILEAVVERVRLVQAPERLLDRDHSATTVLMHAAGAGRSAVFTVILDELQRCYKDNVEDQLLASSADDRTILMHAARCGDQMGVLSVSHACQRFIMPSRLRKLIKQVDGEGVTFLMHAISATAYHTGPPTTTTTTSTTTTIGGGQRQPADEEAGEGEAGNGDDYDEEEEDDVAVAAAVAAAGEGAPRNEWVLDPGMAVLKSAWALVEEVLWKQQVREQLKATDSWGRTIFGHAVLTRRPKVFDAVFFAAREHILDDEIAALMGINKEDKSDTVMETALQTVPRAMAARVARRDQELKRAITLEERASTIESKIQSFIPGKLIVIFQLLLPEVGSSDKLTLLIIMSAIAPGLSWAGSLVAREKPGSTEKRRSLVSLFLSAPAMFFWGLGTSTVGMTRGMGWDDSASAAALAVATIVIPAVDAFFNSRKVEQWYDKWSCQRWRFSQRAHAKWVKKHGKDSPAAAAAGPRATDSSKAHSTTVIPAQQPGPAGATKRGSYQGGVGGMLRDKDKIIEEETKYHLEHSPPPSPPQPPQQQHQQRQPDPENQKDGGE